MNPILLPFLLLVAVVGTKSEFSCVTHPNNELPTRWKNMVDPCINKMKSQIHMELTAAMTYLAMGAHFSRDKINRPGFAHFFFDSASEERQHAIKLLEYLLMRGELSTNFAELIGRPIPVETTWLNGEEALRQALDLETNVTLSITSIIETCESPKPKSKFNDYHLVDYLTADFLTEQYQGQRDLAGKISTLSKMMKNHGALGEFLFDKKLLKGEV